MRIIGGRYRGKKLFSPLSEAVRPTSDRAREAVFNILYSLLPNNWEDYDLLEIFCGSGAFGLEAVSRGIKSACLIDKDTTAAAKNAALFPTEKDKIKLIKAAAENLPFANKNQKYNLYFSDAPYHQGLTEKALNEAVKKGWLANGAICVLETHKDEQLPITTPFKLLDERRYGIAKITILEYNN